MLQPTKELFAYDYGHSGKYVRGDDGGYYRVGADTVVGRRRPNAAPSLVAMLREQFPYGIPVDAYAAVAAAVDHREGKNHD